jgi:hypothetical protein
LVAGLLQSLKFFTLQPKMIMSDEAAFAASGFDPGINLVK